MNNSKIKTLFKINKEVILVEEGDLFLNQINLIKWKIVEECGCKFEEIDIDILDDGLDLSNEIDVSDIGLIYWKAYYPQPIQGIDCDFEVGSDEYLDAIIDGSIFDHIYFTI
jgi:hypothetical protein